MRTLEGIALAFYSGEKLAGQVVREGSEGCRRSGVGKAPSAEAPKNEKSKEQIQEFKAHMDAGK
ncbi:MAG: hypothetical protein ACREEK_03010 [Bradyrhizobium sp.]|jgi:hypothetical protein